MPPSKFIWQRVRYERPGLPPGGQPDGERFQTSRNGVAEEEILLLHLWTEVTCYFAWI